MHNKAVCRKDVLQSLTYSSTGLPICPSPYPTYHSMTQDTFNWNEMYSHTLPHAVVFFLGKERLKMIQLQKCHQVFLSLEGPVLFVDCTLCLLY